jgi:hypothetical protein
MDHKRRENRCKGITKEGKPCCAAAAEDGLCFFHANPNKAVELGRIGGRRNSHNFGTSTAEPPHNLKSAKGVLDVGARLIEDVYTGRVSPRVAGCLGSLLNMQMRAVQATEIEIRIGKLELSMANVRRQVFFPVGSSNCRPSRELSRIIEPKLRKRRRR